MASTFSAAQSEFSSEHALPGSRELKRNRPSIVRRGARRLTRFLFVFCIGAAATLAWQSYGDVARAMIASSSPQLGWLAPEAAPVTQAAPDMAASAAPAAPATPSADVQQLKELTLGLDALRQSVDQLAAQVAAGQRQMASDIAKLHAEISTPPPQRAAAAPAVAPARKPLPPPPAMPLSLTQPSAAR